MRCDRYAARAGEPSSAPRAPRPSSWAPGRVDGAACERLAAARRGVPGAPRAPRCPSRRSSRRGPRADVGGHPGLVAQLARAPLRAASLGGAAASLGVASGDPLDLSSGRDTVAAVFPYPDDGRRSGLGYSAVSTVARSGGSTSAGRPRGRRTSCRVAVHGRPSPTGMRMPAPRSCPSSTQRGASFRRRGVVPRSGRRPSSPWRRPWAHSGSGFAGVRARRLELASARHVGVSVIDQARHLVARGGGVDPPGDRGRCPRGPGRHPGTLAAEPAAVIASTALILGAGGVGGVAGVLAALATVSERRYVRYFRSRS